MTEYLRLIGVDPGTEFCGICVIDHDTEGTIDSLLPLTLNSNKIYLPEANNREIHHGERFVRIMKITTAFKELLLYHNPNAVACEAPFFHQLHPTAFAPLVETVFALRNTVMDFNPQIPFFLYPPRLVKKVFAKDSFANKEQMRAALSNNQELMNKLPCSITSISEHAVDAIGVGYTHVENLKKELNDECV